MQPMRNSHSKKEFGDWLLEILRERDMSQADLQRAAGLGKGSLSDVVSGRRKVGKDLATAIATALKLPPEQVFRAAGILPPVQNSDEDVEEIVHLAKQLSKEDKQAVIDFISILDRLRGKKK